jgi:hypothetical protein
MVEAVFIGEELRPDSHLRGDNVRMDGSDDLFFQVDGSRFRLYEPGTDPAPITLTNASAPSLIQPSPEVDASEASQFAYEHDLRDYLARNLRLIEPGLTLYADEGITGVEFPAGGRYIDILAVAGITDQTPDPTTAAPAPTRCSRSTASSPPEFL